MTIGSLKSQTGSLLLDPNRNQKYSIINLKRFLQLLNKLPTERLSYLTIHKLTTLRLQTQVYVSYYQTAIHINQLVLITSTQKRNITYVNTLTSVLTKCWNYTIQAYITPIAIYKAGSRSDVKVKLLSYSTIKI